MTLSIIIVNWNVKPILERCLFSVFKSAKGLDYEVFVIDNNSKNGSQKFLQQIQKSREDIHVILNNDNVGFAKACNQGVKLSKGKYILFLNPDTEVYPGSLQKMIKIMQENKNYGIVGCKLTGAEDSVQPSVRNFPTIMSQAMIFLKLHYIFSKIKLLKNYFQYDFDYTKQQEVEQVMGACLMAKKELIDQIGLMDEGFFLWFEEVDFCKRAKDAGWKIVYTPDARVLHHGSQSFKQVLTLERQRIYSKSAVYYFKKHFSRRSYWLLVVLRPVSIFLAYLIQVFGISKEYRLRNLPK